MAAHGYPHTQPADHLVTRHRGETLPVVEPRRPAMAAPPRPVAPWFFAAAMAVGLLVAATAGSSLAILAALDLASAPANLNAIVQGHGRIQLFAFASVFVLALTFEFIVRLNGRPPLRLAPRVAAIALVAAGAIAVAAGQMLEGRADALIVAGATTSLAGALTAIALVLSVRPGGPLKRDLHYLFFAAASTWLVVASLLALAGAFDTVAGIFRGADARAVNEVLLRGFILNTIIAVALRAVPGHLSVPPVTARRQTVVFAGVNLAVLTWLLGSGAALFAWEPVLMRAGDVMLALALLAFTWWSRIPQAFRLPGRGFPRFQTLIPLAWLGAVAYAVALLGFSITGLVPDATPYQQGAVRHIFMLGFMVPLMLAFAHIVLARFGTGTFPGQDALTLAFFLVLFAWPLRIVPALFVGTPDATVRHPIAASGVAVAAAFLIAAVVCAKTAWRIRAQHGRPTAVRTGAPA